MGAEYLRLFVVDENYPAINLYKKTGFEKVDGIYDEVIKEIVNLKDSMQFIFATHNANIPVLGESEKVVACNFEDSSKIEIIEGSIDTPVIQKSIVSIMEGGKEAFTRRKDIYNIWNIK